MRRAKVGLVLGGGSARGWAHIGVIRELQEAGIVPDAVCGCSIGAFVGAAMADGDLDLLEEWACALTWRDVVSFLDVSLRGGLIRGDRLMAFFEKELVDREFGELGMRFACVACDLETGREVWLQEGKVAEAVRASIALPGLLTPVARDGGFLVDGGLVNPVPVSLARAMGMDVVIAVELGSDIVGRALRKAGSGSAAADSGEQTWMHRLLSRLGVREEEVREEWLPSLLEVLAGSLNVMQVRIARSRLAGEPADVLISPRLAQVGLMEFHRASESIAEGRTAARRMMPAIRHAVGLEP